jgi:hypothetical protein
LKSNAASTCILHNDTLAEVFKPGHSFVQFSKTDDKSLNRTSTSSNHGVIMSGDDDFGLSSSDEADLLSLLPTNGAALKRKNENGEPSDAKKIRLESAEPTSSPAARSTANVVLKERFGLPCFRLKQEAAIARLLDGESSVVVFPTGIILRPVS